uniref:Uncharacterized protein n=1 Tax=Rhizophora mucronata TaxID=61149 RepID=A0A2P2NKF5_RHIMU
MPVFVVFEPHNLGTSYLMSSIIYQRELQTIFGHVACFDQRMTKPDLHVI